MFGKKRKNRRMVERAELLDVKLRTSQTRAHRMRLLGVGIAVAFSLTLAVLVVWRGGSWLLDKLIYKNEAFAIRQVEVQTDGVLSTNVIRYWAKVRVGQNLIALDILKVKRDLEILPPIEFVAVERVLPHTLKIRVSEREPVAQTIVTQPGANGAFREATYYLDAEGYVVQPIDPRWRAVPLAGPEHLPIIVGLTASELQPGHQIDNVQGRAGLKLLAEFEHSPMVGLVELQRVNITSPEILQVTTSQNAEITFSVDRFETQFRRWRLICDQYQKWGKAIASIDLSIANNLPVRAVAANSVQPLPPKTIKATRAKKKHV
ncbi:MAG: cell division protein FtsQ/DivIB [Limisphaerales bacterium]